MKPIRTAFALTALTALCSAQAADQPVIGLITKTETNPFFVKMKEGAQQAATAKGAKLLSAAGKRRWRFRDVFGRAHAIAFAGGNVVVAGSIAIYVPGVLWLARFVGFDKALDFGLVPFLWGDLLKAALALALAAGGAAMVRRRLGA